MVNQFKNIYDKSPNELKLIIDSLIGLKQNNHFHSEKDVYEHTKLVVNRLHNTYNDINLDLAGFFHDLGKIDTTENITFKSIGHEYESLKYIERFKDFIIQMNGNYDLIYDIVSEHMRFKYFDNFSFSKKISFLKNNNYEYKLKFDTADYGGYGDICKKIKDVSDFFIKMRELENIQKNNNIIKNKFNGSIIMNIYPNLKGKYLSNKINDFKKYICKQYDTTFDLYVINNDNIIEIFKEFMNE